MVFAAASMALCFAQRGAVPVVHLGQVAQQIIASAAGADESVLHLIIGGLDLLEERSGRGSGDDPGFYDVATGRFLHGKLLIQRAKTEFIIL
jgi:hypothetical protein